MAFNDSEEKALRKFYQDFASELPRSILKTKFKELLLQDCENDAELNSAVRCHMSYAPDHLREITDDDLARVAQVGGLVEGTNCRCSPIDHFHETNEISQGEVQDVFALFRGNFAVQHEFILKHHLLRESCGYTALLDRSMFIHRFAQSVGDLDGSGAQIMSQEVRAAGEKHGYHLATREEQSVIREKARIIGVNLDKYDTKEWWANGHPTNEATSREALQTNLPKEVLSLFFG